MTSTNASGGTALRMTRWLSTIRCWIMYLNLQKVNQKLIRSAIRSDSLVLLLNIMSQQVMPDICQKLKQVQARGHRMPASPEVMATFFAGGISESLRSWFTSGKKCSEEDIKKQLSDIMRAVYQVENIREQKNDTEPIRADTKSEQHTV